MPDLEDSLLGAFVGLAVGDAMGAPLEFQPRCDSIVIRTMVGGGVWNMPPGGWTDDTAMALCLADSLLDHDDFDPGDLARRFVNWWRWGHNSHTGDCFDIGATTSGALDRFERSGNPYAGSTHPRSAGNGSIMRLAPVVLRHWRDSDRMARVARDQSRTTHAAPECLDHCERLARDILGEARGERPVGTDRDRASVRATGYVVDTLEAARWAVASTDTFRDAILAAIHLGEDADTVGAVAGQLAGARHGLAAIPGDWLAALVWRDEIESRARALLEKANT